jgi:hypothetical protein
MPYYLRRQAMVVAAGSTLAIAVALLASRLTFPEVPSEVRQAFERLSRQIDSDTISFEEQVVLEQQLDRLAEATKNRSITAEECETGIDAIRGVVIEYSLTEGLAKNYIDRSTLTSDEKRAASQTLRRYAASFFSGKLDEETAVAIEARAIEIDADGNRGFRETLPDGELRELIAAMDEAADTAGITASLPPIDVCAAVCEIVDRQLQNR